MKQFFVLALLCLVFPWTNFAQCPDFDLDFGTPIINGGTATVPIFMTGPNDINISGINFRVFPTPSNGTITIDEPATTASLAPVLANSPAGYSINFLSGASVQLVGYSATIGTLLPVSAPGGLQVFDYVFSGTPGECYTLDFTTSRILDQQTLTFCNALTTGSVQVCFDAANIAGNVRRIIGPPCVNTFNLGLNEVDITVSDDITVGNPILCQSQTDVFGDYPDCVVAPGGTYRVSAQKDDNIACGLGEEDILAISQHSLGVVLFTDPAQYIAADVDQSGTITAFDIVQIRQVQLGFATTFPVWRFIPVDTYFGLLLQPPTQWLNFDPDIVLPNFTDAQMSLGANFFGVKAGDVDGNCTNCDEGLVGGGGNDALTRANDGTIMKVFWQATPTGNQQWNVELKTLRAGALAYAGMAVQLDASNGQLMSADQNNQLFDQLSLVQGNRLKANLMADDLGVVNFEQNTTLLTFTVQGEFASAQALINQLRLTGLDQDVAKILVDNADQPLWLEVTAPEQTNQVNTVKLSPNPFSSEIFYQIPVGDTPATLRFFDATGKLLGSYPLGKQTNGQLSLGTLPTGLIIYELIQDGQTTTGKLIHR